MSRRFLKKIRNFRLMSGLVITLLTVLSFQNCAPAPQSCSGNSQNCTSTEGTLTSASTSPNSVWGSGANRGSGIAGGIGGNVSSGGRPGSSQGGGISVGGGNSGGSNGGNSSSGGTGGGSSGGSTNPGSGSTSTVLRISEQPKSVTVQEGKDFELTVKTTGGQSPLKYQWYKDGVVIDHVLGQYAFFSETADTYKKAGMYEVQVTDGTGKVLRSQRASVTIAEPQVGCAKGSYFTFTNATWDVLEPKYFTEYFDGPRGKFLLHQSYDTYGIYSAGKYANLSTFSVTADLPYRGTTWISCRTTIPRIHTPQQNPGWTSNSGKFPYNNTNKYSDSATYKYQGQVTFRCHNKKLLFEKNTCKWVHTPPPPKKFVR